MRPHAYAWFSDVKPAALPGSVQRVRDRSSEWRRYARTRSRSASRRGHAAQDVRPHSRRLRRRRASRYAHALSSPALVRDSDDPGTLAILGFANLIGLEKHQGLLSRQNDHYRGLVGEDDIAGIDLN